MDHEVDLSERPFQLYTETDTISAETLIIATGASAKWLGIPGKAKVPNGFGGNGVLSLCDLRWTAAGISKQDLW
jgi:thioredoxin reductase (NADPH)